MDNRKVIKKLEVTKVTRNRIYVLEEEWHPAADGLYDLKKARHFYDKNTGLWLNQWSTNFGVTAKHKQ